MRIRYLLVFLIILFSKADTWAFSDDTTHPELIRRAISASKIKTYLTEVLGFSEDVGEEIDGKTIKKWFEDGAQMEDVPDCRASNHFHNPSLDWNVAGLTDTFYPFNLACASGDYQHNTRFSALNWATGYLRTSDMTIRDEVAIQKNEWDWDSAREYFYTYLTGKDYADTVVAEFDGDRQRYLAKSMQALGQVSHLLQDMAVPAHVRNDFSQGHLLPASAGWKSFKEWWGNPFEVYVKQESNDNWFNGVPVGCGYSAPRITDFWDTRDLNQSVDPYTPSGLLGLSEYTQINFLSEYRMFTSDFPLPLKEHCEIFYDLPKDAIIPINRQYFASTNGHPGEPVHHLAAIGYLRWYAWLYFPDLGFFGGLKLPLGFDDNCYDEYASKLIPRAIGYSADLLDHFFRGRLQVRTIPVVHNNNVYALILFIKNITPTGEEISNGKFSMSVRYTPWLGNPDGESDIFVQTNDINSGVLAYDQEARFIFVPSGQITMEDLKSAKCMLAFKGSLGLEENAVIGKILSAGESKFVEEWDHGLNGNSDDRLWYHTPDQTYYFGAIKNSIENQVLIKENKRFAGYDRNLLNESFIYSTDWADSPYKYQYPDDFRGIPITPNTYVIFKIDDLSINQAPPAPPGYTKAWQYLLLEFNAFVNGQVIYEHFALKFSQPGQNATLPYLHEANRTFQLGVITYCNIFNAFQQAGIAIPDPFYLQAIELTQSLQNLDEPSTIEHCQNMKVDLISIIEGNNE